jgi:serpin B
MTQRILAVASSMGLVVLATGCHTGSSTGGDGGGPSLDQANVARDPAAALSPDALSAAVAANNAFSLALYARISADAGSSNLLTSPLSASLALTMTYAGAAGDTATQMAAALQIEPAAGASIFDGQNALSQALAARGQVAWQSQVANGDPDASSSDYALQVVNSVWGEKTYPWAAPFLTTLAKSYGTGVYVEDFIHQWDAARLAINGWVGDATSDKIENLLPAGALDQTTRMVLVNALHLKLPWASAFDPTSTTTASFTRADGSTVSPSFMSGTKKLHYVDDGQAQVVELPLAGGSLVVDIALPHEGTSLHAYEAGLTAGSSIFARPASTASVTLSLPRVTFTSATFSLAPALKAMGMVDAFNPATADLAGMCPNPPDGGRLYVADVLQKAMVSMVETGVEAAAATAVVVNINIAIMPPETPVTMTVNRPYLVAISDVATGAVLFLGHIVDPTDVGSP